MATKVLPERFDRIGPNTVRHRVTGATFWAEPKASAKLKVDSWTRGNFDSFADQFALDEIRDVAAEVLRGLPVETPAS